MGKLQISSSWDHLHKLNWLFRTSWWFQPIWKIWSSNGFIFPNFRGENSKNLWVATTQLWYDMSFFLRWKIKEAISYCTYLIESWYIYIYWNKLECFLGENKTSWKPPYWLGLSYLHILNNGKKINGPTCMTWTMSHPDWLSRDSREIPADPWNRPQVPQNTTMKWFLSQTGSWGSFWVCCGGSIGIFFE